MAGHQAICTCEMLMSHLTREYTCQQSSCDNCYESGLHERQLMMNIDEGDKVVGRVIGTDAMLRGKSSGSGVEVNRVCSVLRCSNITPAWLSGICGPLRVDAGSP